MGGTPLKYLTIIAALIGHLWTTAVAESAEPAEDELPVLLQADELTYDRELGVVIATGNVEVSREGRILLAQSLTYDQKQDLLTASGDVSILEPSGEVVFANYAELTGDLKDGIVQDLSLILSDGARIAAAGGRRVGGEVHDLNKVVYSACDLCPEDPARPPLWQLKAIKVKHDQRDKLVEYRDVWLEVAGIPTLYTPYLSHPDPTVKKKTGLLMPTFGRSSDLGFIFRLPVFVNISPSIDTTITPFITGSEGPGLITEYRHHLQNGVVKLEGSVTEDSAEGFRGHIDGDGRFDIDDTWRWGFDVQRATDDTYLRRYDFSSESTLTSRLFTEGFRGRNYARAEALAFQGLEEEDDSGEIPIVLPLLEYNHIGQPGAFGSRTTIEASGLALTRTDGTDTRRLSVKAGWHLPFFGPLGDVYTLSASVQGDAYHVEDLEREDDEDFTGLTGRVIPELSLNWRYPFVRDSGQVVQMIEPIASFIVSPFGGNPDEIPNEDSLDFEFDDTNLFRSSRFTGVDRVESGPRINYGLKWSLFGPKESRASFLVGQSWRLQSDDTFPADSGLEDNLSDIVARVHIAPSRLLDLRYRTRIDKDELTPRRNELSMSAGPPALRISTSYVFFDTQEDSEFEARQEVRAGVSAKLNRYWRTNGSFVYDVEADEKRSIGAGLTYEDECLVFTASYRRNFFRDRDVEPDNTILFRVLFKTLGELNAQAG